jgi:hypothetical protein
MDAYRYDSSGQIVFVVPTSAGVATVACVAPARRPASFGAACGDVAASLKVVGPHVFALGPDARYRRLVQRTVGRADALTRGLRAARSARGQATAASALAGVFERGLGQLRKLRLSPADAASRAHLTAAWRAGSRAYAALAAAARRQNRRDYRAATARVGAAQRALTASLHELRRDGYARVAGVRRPGVPALRRPKPKRTPPAASQPQSVTTPVPTTPRTVVTPVPTAVRPVVTAAPKPTPVPVKPTPVPIQG